MPKFGTESDKSEIITAKKKKKYYDKHSNEINDETLLNNNRSRWKNGYLS
jgi:hypothetical protein